MGWGGGGATFTWLGGGRGTVEGTNRHSGRDCSAQTEGLLGRRDCRAEGTARQNRRGRWAETKGARRVSLSLSLSRALSRPRARPSEGAQAGWQREGRICERRGGGINRGDGCVLVPVGGRFGDGGQRVVRLTAPHPFTLSEREREKDAPPLHPRSARPFAPSTPFPPPLPAHVPVPCSDPLATTRPPSCSLSRPPSRAFPPIPPDPL